jgi:hypothetical protein
VLGDFAFQMSYMGIHQYTGQGVMGHLTFEHGATYLLCFFIL